jgi:hypothetical protein
MQLVLKWFKEILMLYKINVRPSRECPRCGSWRGNLNAYGESQLAGSFWLSDLCEPCFLDEEEEIEAAGTNYLPNTLNGYRAIKRDSE